LFKTVALPAAAALVAAASPAAAGLGIVTRGRNPNGVILQGVRLVAVDARHAVQPQHVPA
jgi:hypothetical protein